MKKHIENMFINYRLAFILIEVIAAALWIKYFFIAPRYSLLFREWEDSLLLLLFCIVSMSWLIFVEIFYQKLKFKKNLEENRQREAAYDEMENRVTERTWELLQSNQILEAEILERKKVEEEVLEISQKEQQRFGSQLHDGICQDLTGILMLSQVLIKKMEKKESEEVAEFKKICEMLNQVVTQARDMARGLYPVESDENSLVLSLEELTSRSQKILNVQCDFFCPDPIIIKDNNIGNHLYRIAQESIINAVKSGLAQHVLVSLTLEEKILTLSIQDDGNGLIHEMKNTKGIGLQIMKYRARMMDGTLSIEPNIPQGTIIKCFLKVLDE